MFRIICTRDFSKSNFCFRDQCVSYVVELDRPIYIWIKLSLFYINAFIYQCKLGGCLKLVSAIFYQISISHQMIALQKLWKMFFIPSKKLFSLSRYSNFCISIFPLFLPVSHCFRAWSKINLKVYDVINCLNKSLITHFVWYLEKEKTYDIETFCIDRVLQKEHFYGKVMQKVCNKS